MSSTKSKSTKDWHERLSLPMQKDTIIHQRDFNLRAIPRGGLPKWRTVPLAKKLPLVPFPPGEVILSRGRPGQTLWCTKLAKDMRLYDMYGHAIHLPYDGVHDPNLKEHLRKSTVRSCLKAMKLTEKGMATCSIKEMNEFREAIRQLDLVFAHQEFKAKDAMEIEKQKLKLANKVVEKRNKEKALERAMDEAIARRERSKQRLEEEKSSKSDAKEESRLQSFHKNTAMKRDLAALNRERNKLRVAENQLAVQEKERLRLLKILKLAKRRERKLKTWQQKKAEKIAEIRREKVKTDWTNRLARNSDYMKKEEKLALAIDLQRRENIEKRKRTAARMERKQKGWLEDIKMKRADANLALKLQKAVAQMRSSALRQWMLESERVGDIADEKYRITKSFNSAVRTVSLTGSEDTYSYMTLVAAKERLEKERKIPVEVSRVLDDLLVRAIEKYTEDTLELQMEIVVNQSISVGSESHNKLLMSRRKNPDAPFIAIDQHHMKKKKSVSYMPFYRYSDSSDGSLMNRYLRNRNSSDDTRDGGENKFIEIVDDKKDSQESQQTPETIADDNGTRPSLWSRSVFSIDGSNMRRSILSTTSANRKKGVQSNVKFGNVQEFHVLAFPEKLRSTKQRRNTRIPTNDELAELAWEEGSLFGGDDKEIIKLEHKEELTGSCVKAVKVVGKLLEERVVQAINPSSRQKAINQLRCVESYSVSKVSGLITKHLLYEEEKLSDEVANKISAIVAKHVIGSILKLPELTRKLSDYSSPLKRTPSYVWTANTLKIARDETILRPFCFKLM